MKIGRPSSRLADALIGWGVVLFFLGFFVSAAVFGWDVDAIGRGLVAWLLALMLLFIAVALLLWLVAWAVGKR